MNLFQATLDETGLDLGSQHVTLATPSAASPYRGRRVGVGIRPEHLVIHLFDLESGRAIR